jgi:hypothetical protein
MSVSVPNGCFHGSVAGSGLSDDSLFTAVRETQGGTYGEELFFDTEAGAAVEEVGAATTVFAYAEEGEGDVSRACGKGCNSEAVVSFFSIGDDEIILGTDEVTSACVRIAGGKGVETSDTVEEAVGAGTTDARGVDAGAADAGGAG